MKKMLALILLLILVFSMCSCASAAVKPYAQVYEPETSFVLATTVAWKADSVDFAQDEIRPGTAMVYLDAQLKVYDENGALLSESIEDYVEATAQRVIPALYVSDTETAVALKKYLEESGLADVFVVADYKNAQLVREVAQLLHVRGMVDFRSMESVDDLTEIIRTTNGNFAKVALLPENLATKENVRFLQESLLTVWVECESSMKSLLTQYTNGANGVLVSDYSAAIDALAFFNDDAPSLLRVPGIVGHRGMPSVHVENTLESAVGAYEAGADAIETDIYLSADDEIFVLHDGNMERLFNRPEVESVEELTLSELQAIPFENDGENGVQARNHTPAESAVNGKVLLSDEQRIPTLEEIYDAFPEGDVMMDTEIKSHNPEIVGKLKAMVEEKGNFGEVFVITFNTEILDEMVKVWPEMSVGALGSQNSKRPDGQPYYMEFNKIIEKKGVEKALEMLYAEIDRWNATFNPNYNFSYELAVAGRHRGLTVWPWTYNDPAVFADAYLKGLYGLTTNFAWWATDFAVDIRAEDIEISAGEVFPAPVVTAQSGEVIEGIEPELIAVEGSVEQSGEALCIYRLACELIIEGQTYGDYYLYSNPFTVTVK